MSPMQVLLILYIYFLNCCLSRTCTCTHFEETTCDLNTLCEWMRQYDLCRSIEWALCEMDDECKDNRDPTTGEPDADWPFDCPQQHQQLKSVTTTTTPTNSDECSEIGKLRGQLCECTLSGPCKGLADDCEDGPQVSCSSGGTCCCGTCQNSPGGNNRPPPPPPQNMTNGNRTNGPPPPPPKGGGGQPPPPNGGPPPQKGGGSGGQSPPPKKGKKGGGRSGGATPTMVAAEKSELISYDWNYGYGDGSIQPQPQPQPQPGSGYNNGYYPPQPPQQEQPMTPPNNGYNSYNSYNGYNMYDNGENDYAKDGLPPDDGYGGKTYGDGTDDGNGNWMALPPRENADGYEDNNDMQPPPPQQPQYPPKESMEDEVMATEAMNADVNIIEESPNVGKSLRFGYAEIFIAFICMVLLCCVSALCWVKRKDNYDDLEVLVDQEIEEKTYNYSTFDQV